MRTERRCQGFRPFRLFLIVTITLAMIDHTVAFGVVGRVTKQAFRRMQDSISEFAEAVNGEMYTNALLDQDETDSVVGETDKLLVSALPSLPRNTSLPLIDVDFTLSESVSPCSPPLTYSKFLTMQVFSFHLSDLFVVVVDKFVPLPSHSFMLYLMCLIFSFSLEQTSSRCNPLFR